MDDIKALIKNFKRERHSKENHAANFGDRNDRSQSPSERQFSFQHK